jgi:phosphoglycolate phosphatase-like HAD superfamily hydrolase
MTSGIICDVGGTLLLTDQLHRSAWQRALHSFGLDSDANVAHATEGLAKGLDSFAIAGTMGIEGTDALKLALLKQEVAKGAVEAAPNPRTLGWLRGRADVRLAAISHSDEAWTRHMLQLAGVLELFCFVRGRNSGRDIPKHHLLGDAATLLAAWWEVDDLLYCGDTELDRAVAQQLSITYVDSRNL